MERSNWETHPKNEDRFSLMSFYSSRILAGETVKHIADSEKISIGEVNTVLQELKELNPCLYRELVNKLSEKCEK